MFVHKALVQRWLQKVSRHHWQVCDSRRESLSLAVKIQFGIRKRNSRTVWDLLKPTNDISYARFDHTLLLTEISEFDEIMNSLRGRLIQVVDLGFIHGD